MGVPLLGMPERDSRADDERVVGLKSTGIVGKRQVEHAQRGWWQSRGGGGVAYKRTRKMRFPGETRHDKMR
jgi:hypothetical protein